MNEKKPSKPADRAAEFSRQIGVQETRKLKARRRRHNVLWIGLSVFGLIGWSVAVPALLGCAFGMWLDAHCPIKHSWTLMLMLLGLGLGCLSAWYWVKKEHEAIRREDQENHTQGKP